MTTPTQHLEIFNEKFGVLMLGETSGEDTAHQRIIKQHLIQTVISVLEEQLESIINLKSAGIRNKAYPSDRYAEGYNESLDTQVHLLTATLSAWKALLE